MAPSLSLFTHILAQIHTCSSHIHRFKLCTEAASYRLEPGKVVKTVSHVCALTPQATHKETRGEEGKRQRGERESTLGMNYVERALIQQSSSEVFVL